MEDSPASMLVNLSVGRKDINKPNVREDCSVLPYKITVVRIVFNGEVSKAERSHCGCDVNIQINYNAEKNEPVFHRRHSQTIQSTYGREFLSEKSGNRACPMTLSISFCAFFCMSG